MLATAAKFGPLDVHDLGLLSYVEAWALQKKLAARRAARQIPDTLLLLEHPHTYTLGSRAKREHLLVPQTELEAQAIPVLDVDRGGDITYHGPGQLVVYPLLWLKGYGVGIVQYLRLLEAVLIELCHGYGLTAERVRGYTGAWVGDSKVAAIGAKVDVHGITRHGCALNVNTDLAFFGNIVPCGIHDRGVTSLARLLDRSPAMADVKARFINAFLHVFEQHVGAATGLENVGLSE